MIRYYFIPATRINAVDLNSGIQPLYLDDIRAGNVNSIEGILPGELIPDAGGRRWLQMFYILRIDALNFAQIDLHPEAIWLTKESVLANVDYFLNILGIDLVGITQQSTPKEIERKFIQWLMGQDLDFSEILRNLESI